MEELAEALAEVVISIVWEQFWENRAQRSGQLLALTDLSLTSSNLEVKSQRSEP